MNWKSISWSQVAQKAANSYFGSNVIGILADFLILVSVTLSIFLPIALGWATQQPFRGNLSHLGGLTIVGGFLHLMMKYLLRKFLWKDLQESPNVTPSKVKSGRVRFAAWLLRLENSVAPLGMLILLNTSFLVFVDIETLPQTNTTFGLMAGGYVVAIALFSLLRMHRDAHGASDKERMLFGSSTRARERVLWILILLIVSMFLLNLGTEFKHT